MNLKKIESLFKRKKGIIDEIKSRLLFVISSLIIFRIGSFVPIPGINSTLIAKLIEHQQNTIIKFFNIFSGCALNRTSIFALGIMPYISSSIIIQLLTEINSTLSEYKKEGEYGKKKIKKYTLYCTLILAIFQSISIAKSLSKMIEIQGVVIITGIYFYLTTIISLVCGTIFLIWLGEQITKKGIGNGISMIIFTGIIAGLPTLSSYTFNKIKKVNCPFICLILVLMLIFFVIFFVVFIESGQRRIIINYANSYQVPYIFLKKSTTHLPLKVNVSGVIPAIFASSIILFMSKIVSLLERYFSYRGLSTILFYLQPDQPIYTLLYASAIIFCYFFYTKLVLNPRETADNLKKCGAFIHGIRPGEQTEIYIEKIMNHLTILGALYITFICLIPEFIRNIIKIPFYFSGTSFLIIVIVIIDFMNQLQTLIMSNKYEYALKKVKFNKLQRII